jgi:hypothetical protein
MTYQAVYKKLKVGDLLFDLDGEDRKGFGVGVVKDKKTSFLSVKFSNKELPIFVDNCLFCYDRAGIKGSRRCYSYQEMLEFKSSGLKSIDKYIKEYENE